MNTKPFLLITSPARKSGYQCIQMSVNNIKIGRRKLFFSLSRFSWIQSKFHSCTNTKFAIFYWFVFEYIEFIEWNGAISNEKLHWNVRIVFRVSIDGMVTPHNQHNVRRGCNSYKKKWLDSILMTAFHSFDLIKWLSILRIACNNIKKWYGIVNPITIDSKFTCTNWWLRHEINRSLSRKTKRGEGKKPQHDIIWLNINLLSFVVVELNGKNGVILILCECVSEVSDA